MGASDTLQYNLGTTVRPYDDQMAIEYRRSLRRRGCPCRNCDLHLHLQPHSSMNRILSALGHPAWPAQRLVAWGQAAYVLPSPTAAGC